MSKQEVFNILYDVMETLPRELILLIREYVLFLPTILESEYKLPEEHNLGKIIVLTPNRFVLFGIRDTPRIWNNNQIKYLFQPEYGNDVHDIVRKSDNSFLISHDHTIEEIIIEPFKRIKIHTFSNRDVAHKILIDKNGDIIAGGHNDGIYVIRGDTVIQRLTTGMNCSVLSNSFKIHPVGYTKTTYLLSKKSDGTYTICQVPYLQRIESAIFGHLKISELVNSYQIYEENGRSYAEVNVGNDDKYVDDLDVFGDKVYVKSGKYIKVYRSEYYL